MTQRSGGDRGRSGSGNGAGTTPWRKRLRRTRMGVETALGVRPMGFFSPYRYAASTPAAIAPYAEIEAVMVARRPAMERVLELIAAHGDALAAFGDAPSGATPDAPSPAPRWRQGWFPRLDGAAAYALARDLKPRRIVEVGSGHSTRFLARAAIDGAHACAHACIDPAPRAALRGLDVNWTAQILAPAHLPMFDALEAGDFAVFDSSHLLWPGSDVDIILNRILPRLAPGALVHIHDVFLPDPYPAEWAWRGYTEQNCLGSLLTGGGWEVVFASAYAVTRMDAAARPAIAALPMFGGAYESSLWLRKRAPTDGAFARRPFG